MCITYQFQSFWGKGCSESIKGTAVDAVDTTSKGTEEWGVLDGGHRCQGLSIILIWDIRDKG